MAKSKVLSVKDLVNLLEPGQLGMRYTESLLLFRPVDEYDPRFISLPDVSGWQRINKIDYAVQAIPTLENWYYLLESGLPFVPTQKVSNWLERYRHIPLQEWEIDENIPLFDYQLEAARFLQERSRAMLSLSPGLGKTLTSAYAAGLMNFRSVLVVCPASLLYYWKAELEKWADKLPKKPCIEIWHRQIDIDYQWKSPAENEQHWIITNPETVAKFLESFLERDFQCMIADESIMYKHRESQRSDAIKDMADVIPICWLLTGAPATRYLDDMWHQFHILKPQGYASYWRFARKYCIVDDNEWGGSVVANAPNAEKEIKKNFADIYFSRTQDDVAKIPDWIMEDIDIPMPEKQDEAYKTLREKLYIQLEKGDPNERITVNNHLSLMIRSIQVASNPVLVDGVDSSGKWEALPELLDFYPGPYIVWVNFIKTGHHMREILSKKGLRVVHAWGDTPVADRNSFVNAIQTNDADVIVLNNQVGKFGFTLTKARTAFFVERMYDDSYFQCLHRNRRIGTELSPVIVNMRSVTQSGRKTIDHLIHSTLDYRVGMIKKVTTGDLRKVFEE